MPGSGYLKIGANLAVAPATFPPILTLVAFKRLAHFSQSIQQGHQNLAALSERILDVWRVTAEVCPFKQPVFYHVAQPAHQSPTTDRLEIRVELHGPLWSGG